MLSHPVADMAQIFPDMSQARPRSQKLGGQSVTGLMGDIPAEVEAVEPLPEPVVEEPVGDGLLFSGVAHPGREQRDPGAFAGSGWRPCRCSNRVRVLWRRTRLVRGRGDTDLST